MKNLTFWLGLSLAFLILQGCDRQPVKPNGSPVNPVVGSAPAPLLHFEKATAERLATPGGACNFDVIAGKNRDDASITLTGQPAAYDAWAALDVERGIVGKSVILQLVGAATYELSAPRTKRSDVATYFKKPELIDAGFGGNFSASKVSAGSYELRLLIETIDGKWAMCTTGRKVSVVPSP